MPARPTPLLVALLLSLASALSTWAQSSGAEIHVGFHGVQGLGTVSSGGTHAFVNGLVGQGNLMTFTITNMGVQPLTGLALTLGGLHAQDYAITTPLPVTELGVGGGETTFTLTFTPSAVGMRTAALHIASNDDDENPFIINLTAYGSNPDIQVVEAQGQDQAQGSTAHIGTGTAVATASRIFYIKNVGEGYLRVSPPSLVGSHAAEFAIQVSSGLAYPGVPIQMDVSFTPQGPGTRTATLRLVSDDPDEGTYEFTITGTGDVPGLLVEQTPGTPLASPAACDFGTPGPQATSTTRSFTITNTGTQTLNLAPPLFMVGGHNADFTLTTAPAATVAPGDSTTMTLRFFPQASGTRQAAVLLTHNGPPYSPSGPSAMFRFNLTGFVAPSVFSFTKAVYTYGPGNAYTNVTITRTNASIPASVMVQAVDGTAQAIPPFTGAKRNLDYEINLPPIALSFAAGEETKSLGAYWLPVVPARVALNRQFKMQLSAPSVGATLGTQKEATVQVLGLDSGKPSLSVTEPAANARVRGFSTASVTVRGTAGDSKGLSRVTVELNAADPVNVALPIPKSNTNIPFTHNIQPAIGLNTLVVTSYDLVGNSTAVTRSFTFVPMQTLTVKVQDVNTGFATTVLGDATFTTTSGYALRTSGTPSTSQTILAERGTRLKFTAVPKPGQIFYRWTVDSTASTGAMQVTSLGSELSLTVADADAALTLSLGSTTYDPPPGQGKNVHWLLTLDGQPASRGTGAYLQGTLTGSGGFTGKFHARGQSVPVAATFFPNLPAVFTVAGRKQDSMPVPGGSKLELIAAASGPVSQLPEAIYSAGGSEVYRAPARRAAHSTTNKVRAALLNSPVAAPTKGYYTVTLPTPVISGPPPLPTGPIPAGAGLATVNLTNVGVLTFAGSLADGTAFTQSTDLLAGEEALIYVQQSAPTVDKPFFQVAGLMKFDPDALDSDVTATLNWQRSATPSPKVLLYPQGWYPAISLAAEGGLYSPTVTVQSTIGNTTQASLIWYGGGLSSSIEKTSFTITGNSVVKTLPADASYALTLAPATGIFSGTFTPNWANPSATKPAFRGILVQKGRPRFATGYFLNNAKTPPPNGDGGGAVSLATSTPAS